jgi:hypothetical protein
MVSSPPTQAKNMKVVGDFCPTIRGLMLRNDDPQFAALVEQRSSASRAGECAEHNKWFLRRPTGETLNLPINTAGAVSGDRTAGSRPARTVGTGRLGRIRTRH